MTGSKQRVFESGNGVGDWSVLTFLTLKLNVFMEYKNDLLNAEVNMTLYVAWSFKWNLLIAAVLCSDQSHYLLCGPHSHINMALCTCTNDINFHLTTNGGPNLQ